MVAVPIISDIEPLAKAVVNVLCLVTSTETRSANILSEMQIRAQRCHIPIRAIRPNSPHMIIAVSEEMDKMEGAYDYDAVVSVQWPFGYGLS